MSHNDKNTHNYQISSLDKIINDSSVAIEFENVYFAYTEERMILKMFHLQLMTMNMFVLLVIMVLENQRYLRF